MKKFFTLIYISHDGSSKKQFNINLYLFRTLLAIFIIFIISVIIMAIYLGKIYSDAMQKQIYENRVKELELKVAQVEKLKKDIKYLYEREEKLKNLLGVNIQNSILKNHKEDLRNIKIDTVISMENIKTQVSQFPDIWPVKGIISRGFSKDHPAIDIAATLGSPVVSPVSGNIVSVGWDKIFGNYVKIKSNNLLIFFGHLQKVFVSQGQPVKKGEIVGLVGNTGKSTAPHLHYEIVVDSIFVDPKKFLP